MTTHFGFSSLAGGSRSSLLILASRFFGSIFFSAQITQIASRSVDQSSSGSFSPMNAPHRLHQSAIFRLLNERYNSAGATLSGLSCLSRRELLYRIGERSIPFAMPIHHAPTAHRGKPLDFAGRQIKQVQYGPAYSKQVPQERQDRCGNRGGLFPGDQCPVDLVQNFQ